MTELTSTEAVQSYLDTETEVSAAGIIEHLEASGFAVVDRPTAVTLDPYEGWSVEQLKERCAQLVGIAADREGWQPIETAPKDQDIWACDPDKGYAARVRIVIGNEAECIDHAGRRMGIGFYPKLWRTLPQLGICEQQ